jgi:hypothetical protein
MATDTLPAGASARIITHDRFDRPTVVQHPRRGRLPNSVIKFWKALVERNYARYMERMRQEEIEKTRQKIEDHAFIASQYRIHLASLHKNNGAVQRSKAQ